jgi:hypothetical protein
MSWRSACQITSSVYSLEGFHYTVLDRITLVMQTYLATVGVTFDGHL